MEYKNGVEVMRRHNAVLLFAFAAAGLLFASAAHGQVMQNPGNSLFSDFKASKVGDAVYRGHNGTDVCHQRCHHEHKQAEQHRIKRIGDLRYRKSPFRQRTNRYDQ